MTAFLNSLLGKFKKQNITTSSPVTTEEKKTPPLYITLVEEFDRMIEEGQFQNFTKQESAHLITYIRGNRKILSINKNSNPPRTYFLFSGANQRAKELAREELRPVSKNEAKQKRYGPAKALYTGTDVEVLRSMLDEAGNEKRNQ